MKEAEECARECIGDPQGHPDAPHTVELGSWRHTVKVFEAIIERHMEKAKAEVTAQCDEDRETLMQMIREENGQLLAERDQLRQEVERLKDGINAIYANMQKKEWKAAHRCAKVVIDGGDVTNPLDFERLAD